MSADAYVRGLPEPLPGDEAIVWQGTPQWRTLARRALHLRMLTVYFLLLLAWRAIDVGWERHSTTHGLMSIAWLVPLVLVVLAMIGLFAWLVEWTTVYTITTKRVVMRIGVVLTITFNLPFSIIESAGLCAYADGSGDIALSLAPENRIAFLHLWPHARPWRLGKPEPTLRAIADAPRVAALLAQAVAAAQGTQVRASAVTSPEPWVEGLKTPLQAALKRGVA